MELSAEDILAQLDESARQFRFPGFNNMNYHLGTARLSAFRSAAHWALVFEELVWWPAGEGITLCLSVFGTGLAFPGGASWSPGLIHWPHSPVSCGFDDQGELSYDGVSIRGQLVALRPEELERHPDVPERGFAMMVRLLESHRDELLCTPEELRRVVPDDMEFLLQLDQWHHPDVYRGELPSQNPSFQNLAEVLASGEAARLRPAEKPNVDWRLWTER